MKKQYIKNMKPEEIIERLSGGEVIKEDNSDKYFKMINGIICHLGKLYCVINVKIRTDKYYYFETKEPFVIKETGLYKTRGGRKVFVSNVSRSNSRIYKISGIIEGDQSLSTWTVYGNMIEGVGCESDDDIISKWEE